ncbi:MAG: hypothetical protein HYU97_10835 [Deltaproteobacteria bacterium]|nr:hypothetical protein [Deltaproteobacteria bacterium]
MKLHLFLLFFLIFVIHCRSLPKVQVPDLANFKTPDRLSEASEQNYRQALNTPERMDAIQLTLQGYAYANRCLAFKTNHPPCLYFRALNVGIYYQNYILGYQKGLKSMVRDLIKVTELDPAYAHGGAFRALGVIYAKAPNFSPFRHGITKDLDKSLEYLKQSILQAPDYALNHLFLANTFIEMDKITEARVALIEFERLKNESQLNQDYPPWQKEYQKLQKKLKNN